jgi:predicted LPLAT superfamily acyltransferase
MFLLLGAGIAALVRRWPVADTMLRVLRRAGTAIGRILLLAYVGQLIFTLQAEKAVTSNINQRIQHEGQCFARTEGVTWPAEP